MNTAEHIKKYTKLMKASIRIHSDKVQASDNSDKYKDTYKVAMAHVFKILDVVEKITFEEETLERYKQGVKI